MPQEINLDVSPYYDDYEQQRNYYQVLFKPGVPVQARELTTLQSILQNQIERLGTHIFKDGARVSGGEVNYNSRQQVVILDNFFEGINVDNILPSLVDNIITGQTSKVSAKVSFFIDSTESEIRKPSLYINYQTSSTFDPTIKKFLPGEVLTYKIETGAEIPIATVFSEYPTSTGSFIEVNEGIYYIRGRFLNIKNSRLLVEQYSNSGSFKVGFFISEEFINTEKDESLFDNSKGFNNFAAPGADRLRITPILTKIPLNTTLENFITIKQIINGVDTSPPMTTELNELGKEFARRTFDESGDYYVKPANIMVRETLNDLKGNNGIFNANTTTYYGNIPSEDLGTYVISPFKAYVQGFEITSKNSTYIDFKKPRTTKILQNQNLIYNTGATFILNRVYGSPQIGVNNTYFVKLSDSRIGVDQTIFPEKEIGLARVYDFYLDSGNYDTDNLDKNEWGICLYDVQTYTEITLNEPITLSIPTHIKGRSSGATGFIRYEETDSTLITVYNTTGTFIPGESLILDGISDNRICINVKTYSISDVKSIFSGESFSTFSSDVKQETNFIIESSSITTESAGVSTVTSSFIPTSNISEGDIISYTLPGNIVPTFSKVETISPNTLTITGITTVQGICDGQLPQSLQSNVNIRALTTKFSGSEQSTLYTPLPKDFVESVDLTNSNLILKKEFDVNIISNSTNVISLDVNEVFLPFNESRYSLIRGDGVIEPLSSDKFEFISGGNQLKINGLGSNTSAKLIVTTRKINIKSKIKIKNRVKTLTIDKTTIIGSGTGQNTLNNGLTYGNFPYGTRVEDREICLLEPDVTRIYSIFESNTETEPKIPTINLSNISSSSGTTNEIIIGENFVGQTSKVVGVCVRKVNSTEIEFVTLNSATFLSNEVVVFSESNLNAVVSTLDIGDKNITNNFEFSSNQKETFYDFSKIIRKATKQAPSKQIKIIFESARFDSSDDGDLITANSYRDFEYCKTQRLNGRKMTDLIDIRPRVSDYTVQENTRSPFEFLSRNFTQSGNNVNNILATGESFSLSYSFYLPRIDRIFVDKNGLFQVNFGIPDEIPKLPSTISNSLEIASVYLPPYLCDISDATVNLVEHKRYRMVDIRKLENRIENLEYYTSLNLLESNTASLQVKDFNGLDRFKSGFFVDNFSTTLNQKKITSPKNSIDVKNSELRPPHFTTEVDLILGNTSILSGEGGQDLDLRINTNIVGSGIKRTGQVITLDYEEVEEIVQPYATKNDKIKAYTLDLFIGNIQLTPSSDIWVDQVKLAPKIIEVEGNYTQTLAQNDFDPQTGFSPIVWNSWETTWTGSNDSTKVTTRNVRQSDGSTQVFQDTTVTTTTTGVKTRTGEKQILKESFEVVSSGENTISKQIKPFVRSRNVEFVAKALKLGTQLYPFLDGVDISQYVFPKLIEIEMVSGVFTVGEIVKGFLPNIITSERISPSILFRVAQKNHKSGSYNQPVEIYTRNPFNINQIVPTNYSENSNLINIDTFSLSNQSQGEYFGRIVSNMKLIGLTSGAEAVVKNVNLITDLSGSIIGSIFIPDPNLDINPKFEAGELLFTLTSSPVNSKSFGTLDTFAEQIYYSSGFIENIQENIISTRNATIETVEKIESIDVSDNTVNTTSTLLRTIPAPPPPPPISAPPPPPPPPQATFTINVNHVFDDLNRRNLSLSWSPTTPISSITSFISSDGNIRNYTIRLNQSASSLRITSIGNVGGNGGFQPSLRLKSVNKLNSSQWKVVFERLSESGGYRENFVRDWSFIIN